MLKKYWNRRHQDPLCSVETKRKKQLNFPNCKELINAILNLTKDDKCIKCKNLETEKRGMHALWTHGALLDMNSRQLFLLIMYAKIV